MSFSNELITVFNYLGQKLGIAIDWTFDNVMPYLEDLCRRFIEYEILNSFMTVGAWALFMLFFMCWLIPTHLVSKHRLDWDSGCPTCWVAVIAWIGFGICLVGVVASAVIEGFHIIECWKMPEKVVTEYIQSLLDSAK